MTTILVTGGAGFIGSAFIRMSLQDPSLSIVNVDRLTYAGNLDSLSGADANPRYVFRHMDICDGEPLLALLEATRPDAIVHFAAESHVDRSSDGPAEFLRTNVHGTFTLLQQALHYWRSLSAHAQSAFRFVHVSTDEVYGSLGEQGLFTEASPHAPNSPDAASKASADHFVRAWHHTYGLPTVTTNCSNNYGPCQFPEKLIPLTIQNALHGKRLPVYGRGENVRDWLYVDDHCRALRLVMERGTVGSTYNIGGSNEWRNVDVVEAICQALDELAPDVAIGDRRTLIEFVTDRPGHDLRYAIDASRIRRELGWTPLETFHTGLRKTVQWYLENQSWCERVQSGAYRGERLGLGASS